MQIRRMKQSGRECFKIRIGCRSKQGWYTAFYGRQREQNRALEKKTSSFRSICITPGFLKFAPLTFREERAKATKQIEHALEKTANFTNVTPDIMMENPQVVQMLRMGTRPTHRPVTGLSAWRGSTKA